MANLKIEYVKLSEIKPYENNPKIHTEKQIEQIAKSIELTKGLRQPIVIDKNNVIVCGHGRYLAAKKLGYDTVPCELVDDLTDDEIRAYRLIDNRIAQGEFDLSLELEELSNIEIDLGDFGFDLNLTMKRNKPNTPPLLTAVTMMILLMSAIRLANTMYLRIKTACNSLVSDFTAFPKCRPHKQSVTKC